jgi:tetratricopeptide (TPR) repeat protein
MPSVKEAGLRHARYYAGYTKQHREERPIVWPEFANLAAAYRFYSGCGGQFDPEFISYVTDLERALDAEAYWQELIPMLTDAQQACERTGDDAKRARLILALAQMHTNLGLYRQALVWLELAISLAQQSGSIEALAKGHLQIGWTHIYLGDLMQSLDHLAKARQLATSLKLEL